MANYFDIALLPLPKKNKEAYQKMASFMGEIWMKHGALSCYETVAADLSDIPGMNTDSFAARFELAEDETIIVAFIAFESREQRDEIQKKVMSDPAMAAGHGGQEMPFDMKRMIFGQFEVLVAIES